MRQRRLDPEEEALWRKVTGDVRPLDAPRRPMPEVPRDPSLPSASGVHASGGSLLARSAPSLGTNAREQARAVTNTLDGGWDRKLGRGTVQPDMTVDLHGHTLASAHAALDAGLAHAVASHARIVLLVTGRPRPDTGAMPRRGAIRAGVPDWLARSRFADRIAAVRVAHQRHGGAGALYLILRRAGR